MTAYVVGAMTAALDVPLVGRVDLFGVRFHPGAGMPLLGAPAPELTDAAWPLEALCPDERWLAERLAESDDRVQTVTRTLERLLGSSTRRPDRRVMAASRLIEAHRGDIRIERIAEACGIGRRQLERLFQRDVGTSPKVASRVARLQHAVALVRAAPEGELARVAATAGYADQAHLTREFKTLTGLTPNAFRRREA